HCAYISLELQPLIDSANLSNPFAVNDRILLLPACPFENALAHQACVLRFDLEKSLQDNASLHLKIGMMCQLNLLRLLISEYISDYWWLMWFSQGREGKLNIDNRLVVNNFQTELLQQLGSLGNTVATSVSQQNEQLLCIEKFCHSFLDIHKKVDAQLTGLNETVTANKTILDGHVSSKESITTDAKRKWLEFSKQAENDAKDSADFSAAKHCRMESLLQQW
ncbi:hypothetical protein U1Q18_046168, partial [Sarracenia purpurea var. burkii]